MIENRIQQLFLILILLSCQIPGAVYLNQAVAIKAYCNRLPNAVDSSKLRQIAFE
mgnify:CR=1 FL=1